MTPTTPDSPTGDPLLQLVDIRMHFGGVTALKSVKYDVPEGVIQSVIGPNGAGKTTLLHCVSGLLEPSGGRVLFLGEEIQGRPPHRIARLGLSRTFQHVALFQKMSVLENVMVGRHPRTRSGFWAAGLRWPGMMSEERRIREAAEATLAFVGLSDLADRPAGSLPLGQQKMLEIARALATEPRLLLLDEPAGGLNTRETEELGGLIQKIREKGVTIVLVEHDMNLVMEISDRIVVLHYGRILASGSPGEIKDNPEVIQAYLGEDWSEGSRTDGAPSWRESSL